MTEPKSTFDRLKDAAFNVATSAAAAAVNAAETGVQAVKDSGVLDTAATMAGQAVDAAKGAAASVVETATKVAGDVSEAVEAKRAALRTAIGRNVRLNGNGYVVLISATAMTVAQGQNEAASVPFVNGIATFRSTQNGHTVLAVLDENTGNVEISDLYD